MVLVYSGLVPQCAGFQLAGNEGDNPTLSELCPYNNYCHANASMVLNSTTDVPCCRPCSCEDDCWKRGDCCPDKEPPSTRPPVEQCLDTVVKSIDLPYMYNHINNGLNQGIQRYYVINSCPDEETKETTVKKCYDQSQESVDDITWVMGSENGKIYRNQFCAECHGVRSFITWDLLSDCGDMLYGDSFKSHTIVPSKCRLIASPPESIEDISSSLCVLPVVSECNVTGAWTVYDRHTEEACKAYDSPFMQAYFIYSEVYRNVFCYLCNERFGHGDVCDPISKQGNTRELEGKFTVLLNPKTLSDIAEVKPEERCDIDEAFEPIQVNYTVHKK